MTELLMLLGQSFYRNLQSISLLRHYMWDIARILTGRVRKKYVHTVFVCLIVWIILMFNLCVSLFPENALISATYPAERNITARIGSDIVLTCQTSNGSPVKWRTLSSATCLSYEVNGNSLHLSNLQPSQASTYTCIVSTEIEEDSRSFSIFIKGSSLHFIQLSSLPLKLWVWNSFKSRQIFKGVYKS